MLRAFGVVLVCFTLFSSMATAETLKLEEEMVGENKAGNKVWAQIVLKNGAKTCGLWSVYCPQGGCKSCVVKYLIDEEREARKLIWSEKDKLWLDQNKKPYDTAFENMKFLAQDLGKRMSQVAGDDKAETSKKVKGRPRTICEREAEEKWGVMPGIWVVDTQGNFYTSVEQAPGLFHHSSFMAGGLVRAAGQVVFVNGKITHINNSSGHYKPDQRSLKHVLKDLHLNDDDHVIEYDLSSSARKSITNMRESKPTRAPSLHASVADARKSGQQEAEDEDVDSFLYRSTDCYNIYGVSQGDYHVDLSKE